MVGKVIKQINNCRITQSRDGLYRVYAPDGTGLYSGVNYNDVVSRCQACKKYIQVKGTVKKAPKANSNWDNAFPFEVYVYADVLALAKSSGMDFENEVYAQLMQDGGELDGVCSQLQELAEDKGIDTEQVAEIFYEIDLDKLMRYIRIIETKIEFAYDETAACGDAKIVAYDVPCLFNGELFLEEQC